MRCRTSLLLLSPWMALSACEPAATEAVENATPSAERSGPMSEDGDRLIPQALFDDISAKGKVTVVVELLSPDQPFAAARTAPERAAVLDDLAWLVTELREGIAADLGSELVLLRSPSALPLMSVEVSSVDMLQRLAAHPDVAALHVDEALSPVLSQSLALIGQPEAESSGFTGAGTAVVVLDTGVDYTHADLGGCSAPGVGSGCRVVYADDFATDDGSMDDNGHGTNVSAIVAGVAPETDIIGLDVFRTDGYAYSSDIILAVDWAIRNKETYGIVALNLSLGGGQYTAQCSSSSYEVAIGLARDAGILAAIASGNNGWTNSMSSPGCIPSGISVGAVYDSSMGSISWSSCTDSTTAADKVTCFSNAASFLDILAPGALIRAGGYSMGGTSQATPHVAGAIAVVAEAWPSDNADARENRLLDSGTTVTDHRTGTSFPRLDVGEAVADASLPTISLELAGGEAWVSTRVVEARVTASASATEMCLQNTDTDTGSCSPWRTVDDYFYWELSTRQGEKTVSIWAKNAAGQVSDPATVSLSVDTLAPTTSGLTATRSGTRVSVSWDAPTDDGSGVDRTVLAWTTGTTPPSSCSAGTLVTASGTTATLSSISASTSVAMRLCVTDAAGNEASAETTVSLGESAAPTGTLTIGDGSTATASRNVTLYIDAPGATEVCLSNTPRCGSWRTMTDSLSWNLPDGDGPRTISAWFRGASGTESEVVEASITLDRSAPVPGAIAITPRLAEKSVDVSWTGFSDDTTSIDHYLVSATNDPVPPRTCSADASQSVSANQPGTTLTGVENPARDRIVVCAVDAAGNISPARVESAASRGR